MKFRSRFSHGDVDVSVSFPDPDSKDPAHSKDLRTKQSFRRDADINYIVAKARKTGILPCLAQPQTYGDFSSVDSYHAAQNLVISAHERFMSLPSGVRDRFKNDPGEFLKYASDPKTPRHLLRWVLGRLRRLTRRRSQSVKPQTVLRRLCLL